MKLRTLVSLALAALIFAGCAMLPRQDGGLYMAQSHDGETQ